MRINRTNPEQPAAQPVQNHAPIKAQTEVNGFETPEQEIPKETRRNPRRLQSPPKPKKEKPGQKPRPPAGGGGRGRRGERAAPPPFPFAA